MGSFRQKFSPKHVMKLLSLYPPFIGAGIRVKRVNDDCTEVEVQMKQSILNSNYVGVHFGGSLYSMCDPFYMFMLSQHMGKGYIVWDKAAEIDFIKPGRGTVKAVFKITQLEVDDIKNKAASGEKVLPTFETYVTDADGNKVAHVKKVLYVRKKRKK